MLKLVSLNIERSKHLDVVIPFLKAQQPDVVCLQELNEADISRFEWELGMKSAYAPHGFHPPDEGVEKPPLIGIAIFAREPKSTSVQYYLNNEEVARTAPPAYVLVSNSVVVCEIEKGGDVFRVANTHFLPTIRGEATDRHRESLKEMLRILPPMNEFVLTGDFNNPRGGEIFSSLASKYKDNVPTQYKTSIDVNIHRVGRTRPEELADKMVDGLFTTPGYRAADVELVSGVSDHCAIVATISKKGA